MNINTQSRQSQSQSQSQSHRPEVVGGAHDCLGEGRRAVEQFGHAEVPNLSAQGTGDRGQEAGHGVIKEMHN